MKNPNDSRSTEQPKYYIISPPTLKMLASQIIAVMNYRFQIKDRCKEGIVSLDWFDDWDFEIKDKLGVHGNFLEKIFDFDVIWPVGVSIDDWVDRNVQYVYFDSERKTDILHCLEHLVLKPHGSICSLNTAKNLMSCDKLSPMKKYRFACVNCLVDDVKNLWPLVCDDFREFESNFEDSSWISYWNCVMRGESPQVSGTDADSVERRAVIFEESEWPAVEYAFDLLSDEDEKIKSAILFLSYGHADSMESMLLKLNRNQKILKKVMVQISPRMLISNLVSYEWLYLCIWDFLKNFMTEYHFLDTIQFLVFDDLFWVGVSYEILSEIWADAPDNMKKFVSSDVKAVEDIFRQFNSNFSYSELRIMDEYYLDMSFFSGLLADLPFELRNSLWCKYWRNFIVHGSPNYLNEVMKLCFNNEDEIIRFKECEMMNSNNIEDFCFWLIEMGRTEELSVFLNFCSTNVDRVLALKREIIDSPRISSYFAANRIYPETFVAFDQFIDSVFIDENDAKKYKYKLIMSSEKLQEVYAEIDKKNLGVPWM